ncbi:outer membrane beta-barrel protein [Pedobacter sp. HDW13]|uniref:outer membrane beta-barrel protein n=1 Tax=Pedobacter sp. HDW13 TaxID=2714940 RepID=UPI0014078737|nr:outer membrane beta-barrel protein [Pedobacter sp. HDW13]QIL39940.1 outer membrane beta-barrel protein [Pedobacter sp. HDW13]
MQLIFPRNINRLLACLTLLLFCKTALAQNTPNKWEIKPSIGIQQAKSDWSIAGNASGTSPNILSELVWKNLKGPNFGLDAKYHITNRLSIKTGSQYSNITKGEVEDTDYADDNRQNAFYFDLLDANKGYLFNTSLQLSYQLLNLDRFAINPIIGLSYNQQKFHLLESASNINSAGLNSTYQTRYKGFDFGLEGTFKAKSFRVTAGILGGFYTYSAKANWNLIPDFQKPVSFTHAANSFALNGNINLAVPLNKTLQIELDYKINNINTYSGVDRAYFNNKQAEETQFNGANFRANTIALGLNFSF